MGIHKRTHASRYGDEVIQQIERMAWVEKKSTPEIATALGMRRGTVNNLMNEYAICTPRKPYRLPKFSGWDFSEDNIAVAD